MGEVSEDDEPRPSQPNDITFRDGSPVSVQCRGSRSKGPALRAGPFIHAQWTNAALRKRINRIIARATLMKNGGYLALLRGDAGRAKRFRQR